MREHTSVNALVREFLTRYTNVRQRRLKALDMLDGLAQRNAASSSGDWSRESLHERWVVRVFVDTNIWVCQPDQREPDKRRFVAAWLRELVQAHDIVVSTQVMIEFRSVLCCKLKPAFSAADTRLALNALAAFEVVATNANMVMDAHELAVVGQLSWFDALIAEAALRSDCTVLYSEDFSHGQTLGGKLLVQNPLEALQ